MNTMNNDQLGKNVLTIEMMGKDALSFVTNGHQSCPLDAPYCLHCSAMSTITATWFLTSQSYSIVAILLVHHAALSALHYSSDAMQWHNSNLQ